MPNVSEFISPSQLPPEDHSFKAFQDLPLLVRDALVWATKEQDAGNACDERDVTTYIITRYDFNQTTTIGGLTDCMIRFINSPVRCRMVRCFVDHGCNMLAAKLAWHEEY